MSPEIIVGALAAAASLAAGLIKTVVSRSRERGSEAVTMTLQRGTKMIEKKGMIRPDDVPRLLDMIREDPALHAK